MIDGPLSDEVVALLSDLRINVNPDNSESTLNGSLELILHTMECVNALRQVNETIPPDQLDLTGGLFIKAQNEFSAAIGRILMFIMSTKPMPNLTELLQITVSKILSLFPESAAHDSYRNGTSLLHHAVSKAFVDIRLVEVIHDANPVCAGNPDNEGALPLHRAVANPDISIEVVKFLIAVYPAGTSSADLEGYLPLHWAVNTDRPNIGVIEELIGAYPDACNTTCNMGSLPMHWAVDRSNPDMNVVYLLMKTYAKALRKGCSAGFLPIHRCVDRSNPSVICMKALIKKYPKSLEQDNCDGQLPLHRCVDRCDPSLEAVALLIQSYPGALDTPDVEGYVPLHIALDGESPCIPVVKLLIESCMESTTMKTQDGLLPLHYVLNCQDPSQELVELLVNSYPEGVEVLAVDLYPEDPMADPLNWSGPWKKRKWTPLTRALELGNPLIVDMIRQAIEMVHGDGDPDRARPVSTDSRRSKGASRPSSHNTLKSNRPSSHNSHGAEESTPLKTEHIPGTAAKKPPTSGVRGAATNNYVVEQTVSMNPGGARDFSPAGESPAPQVLTASEPIISSIPTAVPPKQLFPAVSSSANGASSQIREKKLEERKESLPEVSPRGTAQPQNSQSEGSLLKAPAQQPEVEEEPVRLSREKREKSRDRDRGRDRSRRDKDRGDETEEGKEERRKHRKSRSRSRACHEGEGEPGAEDDKHHRHHHRHHHRRHHRHHHRHRDGEEKDGERRRRHSRSRNKDRDSDVTPTRKPSNSHNSAGPGRTGDHDDSAPPRHPGGSGSGGIAMNVDKEAEIAERLRKLELMESEVKRKEEEAAEATRLAFLKAKEAEEILQRIQNQNQMGTKSLVQEEDKNEDDEDEYPPYFNHAYSDKQTSHKFPPVANKSDPKFQPDESPSPSAEREDCPDAILKSLENFTQDTSLSHKFPPANSYTTNGHGGAQ